LLFLRLNFWISGDLRRQILQGEAANLIARLPRLLASSQASSDVILSGSRFLFNVVSCGMAMWPSWVQTEKPFSCIHLLSDAVVQVRKMYEKEFLGELLDLIANCRNPYALGLR